MKTATPTAQARFINMFQAYIGSVVQQAMDRSLGYIRDVDSYFELRRETAGLRPAFAIIEIHMNIPPHVMDHPVIQKLTVLCIDMIAIANDLYSYNVEWVLKTLIWQKIRYTGRQARGDDGHNLVTIVKHQFKFNFNDTFQWISDLYDGLVADFLAEWKNIPTFGGPVDREIRTYLDGLGNWVRGNDSWCFEVCGISKDYISANMTTNRVNDILGRAAERLKRHERCCYFPTWNNQVQGVCYLDGAQIRQTSIGAIIYCILQEMATWAAEISKIQNSERHIPTVVNHGVHRVRWILTLNWT